MNIIKDAVQANQKIIFNVTSPRKSYSGYTIYRITLQRDDCAETSPGQCSFWKRFSEFKKLHKELKSQFQNQFKDLFPELGKGKIFGRFDDAVIEERRQVLERLLMFISSHPDILCHKTVLKFFETTKHQSNTANEANQQPNIQPTDEEETDQLENEEEAIVSPEFSSEEVNVSQPDGNEVDGNHDDDVFLSIQTNEDHESNQSFFQEARTICGDDLESLASAAADEFPFTSPRQSFSELLEANSHIASSRNNSVNSETDLRAPDLASVRANSLSSLTDANFNHISNLFDKKFTVDDKMSRRIEQTIEEDDYIFQASLAMSNATEQEELGSEEEAFELYKFGIGLLLRGVQTDNNKDRREAVRRKTAQYLLKAENLYKGNLCSNKMVLGDGKWRFRLSDVKVFGVVDKIMLVQKIYTEDIYAMKVLHKQGGEYKPNRIGKNKAKEDRSLYNFRFVVKLYNCVETSTGVYLLLEYMSGGRLWDYLELPIFKSNFRQNSSCNEYHSLNTSERVSSFSEYFPQVAENNTVGKSNISNRPTKGFPEDHIRRWAAQIAYALMEVHARGITCRDLNPCNILIDAKGDVKLTYFSKVHGVDYTLDQDAVDLLYAAPEVGNVFEPSKSADWWSYGALLFELLMGEPLYASHPDGITLRSVIKLPKRVSSEACSLLSELLKYNPKERIGGGPNGNEEIKSHPFFAAINWTKLKSA